MDQLNQLIRLFPESGLAEPTPETIAKIRAIDEAIRGTRAELEEILQTLEKKNRANWPLGSVRTWKSFEGTPFAIFPRDQFELDRDGNFRFANPDFFAGIHRERLQTVAEIFSEEEGVVIEDGGVKSYKRALRKLDIRQMDGRGKHGYYCPDFTRLRLVVSGLENLERSFFTLMNDMPLQGVKNLNCYGKEDMSGKDIKRTYQTPFRGVNTSWCGLDENNLRDRIATEVQLVTAKVRAIIDLDHPFNIAQTIEYPNENARDYVHGLMLKASILDFQERFPSKGIEAE